MCPTDQTTRFCTHEPRRRRLLTAGGAHLRLRALLCLFLYAHHFASDSNTDTSEFLTMAKPASSFQKDNSSEQTS